MEQMAINHKEKMHLKSQQMSVIENKLNEEMSVSNKLRSQMRELNIKLKEDGSAWQKEKRLLDQELESVNERLLVKVEEANDLRARFDAEVTDHRSEMEELRTEHAAQLMVIETRSADIVSDLEDALVELEKELTAARLKHEDEMNKVQHELDMAVDNAKMEKERVEQSLADKEKKVMGQQEKITSLTVYAKERKAEAKMVKAELLRAQHTLDNANQEREDVMASSRDELQTARLLHEREISHLQQTVDAVRSELTVAKERLAVEDGELNRAKATLSERTNLLRDMVNQTTAYQGDYEQEHARATQLDEAAQSYKKQLAEVRDVAQRLEGEIHDKDTHYCDAIRNERQQRKTMESELESSRKSMEDTLRKNAEVEKSNSTLKDKVSRQEKYIGRLQDREKQNRRTSTMGPTATSPRRARPSTAGARSPVPNGKERVMASKHRGGSSDDYYAMDENERPNIRRLGGMGGSRLKLPQSPDELTSLLG